MKNSQRFFARALASVTAAAALAGGQASAQTPAPAASGRPVPVVHHAVTTVPEAQAAFDRGLLDYYAYNPQAAEHEFYTAADLDKHLAMAYWGIALANAPNLNVDATDDRDRQAAYAIDTAKDLERYASPEDAALIDAAYARFNADPKAPKAAVLAAYRDALRQVSLTNPNDPDAAALYAEAALYAVAESAADLKAQATPARQKSFAASVARLLPYYRASLAKFPTHVGLLHFYIHAAQLAGASASAVGAAQQLAAFAFPPEDSHLTHMPGHTFFDVGMYDAALDVGQRSVAMDAADIACCHPGFYAATRFYHWHNVDFLLYALTQTGHLSEAVEVARSESIPQMLARQLVAAQRWREVVALPTSKGEGPVPIYARALAYAKLGDAARAATAITAMPKSTSSYQQAVRRAMTLTVHGEIALDQHDDAKALAQLTAASASLSAALAIQPAEIPPLFYYSPHLALAQLAMRLGKTDVARLALAAELLASPKEAAATQALSQLAR